MRRCAFFRSGSMKALYMGYTVSDICTARDCISFLWKDLEWCKAGG